MAFSEKPDFSEKSGFLNTRKLSFEHLGIWKLLMIRFQCSGFSAFVFLKPET